VPPRVYAAVGGIAVVLAAIVVVAAAGLDGHGSANAGASRPPVTTPARAATPTTLRRLSTPTTQPVAVVPVVARSTGGATVTVHSPFQLTLRASGTCWVQVTDTTQRVLFSGTLHAGQQQQLPVAGAIVVRLGYTPAITISVDGVTLDLSGLAQTANVQFQS